MQKKISFKNNKSYILKGVLHLPEGDGPFPAVIVQHGLKGDHERPLVKFLSGELEKAGFVVLRFSLSGHKPSGGSYQDVLISQFLKDLKAGLDFLLKVKEVDKKRIGLIGHSMGAFNALMFASQEKKIKALAPIGSYWDIGRLIKSFQDKGKVSEINRDYFVLFSRGTGQKFKVTVKHFEDKVYSKKEELIKAINCPALVIYGSQDDTVYLDDSKMIYDLLKHPKKLKVIKGGDHLFIKSKKHQQQIFKEVLSWFKKYL